MTNFEFVVLGTGTLMKLKVSLYGYLVPFGSIISAEELKDSNAEKGRFFG